MYIFNIKDNSPDVNILVTRCLLALAAIVSLLYRAPDNYYVNIAAAIFLFIVATFVNTISVKYKVNTIVLLCIAAIGILVATRSVGLAILLVIAGSVIKKLNKQPVINVNTEGIIIKKMFGIYLHPWSEFNNIILKDGLLTLDFKDNKLLQLNIEAEQTLTDEGSFNNFCSRFIGI